MTLSEFDNWLFEAVWDMNPEQRQRWLETCYLKTNVDELFADPDRSVAVVTHAGCGITTSLARLETYRLLHFQYDPDQWPGRPQSFTNAPDHFGQWMGRAAFTLIDQIRRAPALLGTLTRANYEFLTWAAQRYLNRNQNNRWHHVLQTSLPVDVWGDIQTTISDPAFVLLFGTAVADMVGQIDECLDVAQRLGWQGIYASIDIQWEDWIKRPPADRDALKEGVRQLLSSLTLLQRPGFGFKMGIPHRLFSLGDVRALVRGRANVVVYDWSPERITRLADQLMYQATSGQSAGVQMLSNEYWQNLHGDVVSIWETLGPAAAVALVRQALQAAQAPLEIRQGLYRSSARLCLDNDPSERRVWRGMTPIRLTDAPFELFKKLWEYQGEPVSNRILLDVSGSKENADQNISRIRKAIEPFYAHSKYLYIQRDVKRGAWLDRDMCDFD